MSPIEFKSPWSQALRVKTALSVILLLASVAIGWLGGSHFTLIVHIALLAVPLAILLVAARCAVVGYALTEQEVRIKHLGRMTRLPLSAITAVEGNVAAMEGSVCLLANPGIFSVTGVFWNRRLKLYRAFATDPSRAVVLRFRKRAVVITPHDPQHFIMRARTLVKVAAHPLMREA